MMNPRIKLLWVEALLSGKYKQVTGKLKTPEGFCCLGVLTDLYIKEHQEFWSDTCTWEEGCGKYSYFMNDSESLSDVVSEWAGLSEPESCLLSDMNDLGDTFEEIVNNHIIPNL